MTKPATTPPGPLPKQLPIGATRAHLVLEARRMLGVRFQHAGRNQYGVDCVGLLVLASRAAGMTISDDTSYSPIVNPEYLRQRIATSCEIMPAGTTIRVGDVVLFNIGGAAQHVALVTEVTPAVKIIHAFQTVGRVVEHELDRHWAGRIVCYYRPRYFLGTGTDKWQL